MHGAQASEVPGTPMKLFLSYKRGVRMTPAVERFYDRLSIQVDGDVFFDRRSIDAGDEWWPRIDEFLRDATHFVAFVSIDYWLSVQCRRELDIALDRYEASLVPPPLRQPRLLFVLADPLSPAGLRLDRGAASLTVRNAITTAEAGARARPNGIGHINFLGPYDAAGQLVRLRIEDEVVYDVQLNEMIAEINRLDANG